ncbi:uncharacterized protein FFE2_03239 [Fusarium fujikuroi]|jgi:hypothetical protein
MENL